MNLSSLCAHLNCPLEACVLCWLLLLDPRGIEWPAKIKTWFPTPLIKSHTLDFRRAFTSWSSNPKANLSDHAELKWIYPATPRTCRFRVIEVGVRCFWAHTCIPGISYCTSRSHFSPVTSLVTHMTTVILMMTTLKMTPTVMTGAPKPNITWILEVWTQWLQT